MLSATQEANEDLKAHAEDFAVSVEAVLNLVCCSMRPLRFEMGKLVFKPQ
jgi:hypothetical protein